MDRIEWRYALNAYGMKIKNGSVEQYILKHETF